MEPFAFALLRHGLSLVRGPIQTLQVATGLLCDRACRHRRLEAGPGRREIMSRETMEAVAGAERDALLSLCVDKSVALVASFPRRTPPRRTHVSEARERATAHGVSSGGLTFRKAPYNRRS